MGGLPPLGARDLRLTKDTGLKYKKNFHQKQRLKAMMLLAYFLMLIPNMALVLFNSLSRERYVQNTPDFLDYITHIDQ